MRYGEIKVAAIKLMFDNLEDNITADDIERLYEDRNYASRLVNMPEAVNRALDRAAAKGKLPKESAELDDYIIASGSRFTRYDISAISDLSTVERVVFESDGEYRENYPYKKEGSYVLVLPTLTEGCYRLIYNTKPRKVTADTWDEDEIRVPENIARLIPYFVKAELYEDDEPAIADKARKIFENGLDEINTDEAEFAPAVEVIFRP